VFLSSPHQTPHPFFEQPNPMAVLHADIERLLTLHARVYQALEGQPVTRGPYYLPGQWTADHRDKQPD
jgi:hypothetical protein